MKAITRFSALLLLALALGLSACSDSPTAPQQDLPDPPPFPGKTPVRINVFASRTGLASEMGELPGLTVDSDMSIGRGFYTWNVELAQLPRHIGVEVSGPGGLSQFRPNADTVFVFLAGTENSRISGNGFWKHPDSTSNTTLFFTVYRTGETAYNLQYGTKLYHGRNGYSDRPTHFPWVHLPASFRIPDNPGGVPHYTATGHPGTMQTSGRSFYIDGPQGETRFGSGPLTTIQPENGSSYSFAKIDSFGNLVLTNRPN